MLQNVYGSLSKRTRRSLLVSCVLGSCLATYVLEKKFKVFSAFFQTPCMQRIPNDTPRTTRTPKSKPLPSPIKKRTDNRMLDACTAILFLGSRGSGRSTAIRVMRPWLRQWAYSSRHLTIANVVGKGYVKGSYSEKEWQATYKEYTEEMKKDGLFYVKRLLDCVQERDAHPTVMMVSNIHDAQEVAFLRKNVGKVIVIGINREVHEPFDLEPFGDDLCTVKNTGDETSFTSSLRMTFVGHVLPRMRTYLTLDDIKTEILKNAISVTSPTQSLSHKYMYYDMYSLWSQPKCLSSVMYAYASLLRVKEVDIDCVVAVSEKAIPLTSFLSHMLGCRNIILLHHTQVREKTPFDVAWGEGKSAFGPFAVGWPKHLTRPGQKVLLFDDILATGNKARAVIELAKEVGVHVSMFCVLFQIGSADLPESVPVLQLINF